MSRQSITIIEMISLENYGWNAFHQQYYIASRGADQFSGRVISIKGFKYELITERGELETELSGKLLFGQESENLPKVGDWVFYLDYGATGYIVGVFPRMNSLSRKNPGNKMERQVLGANIDYALIVQGLDRDFNVMRLERYLTQVTACGVTPVVILNKADLIQDREPYRNAVEKLRRDCALFFCSTFTGAGIEDISKALEWGKTYIMIGSSGVGKSSLLNKFSDGVVQETGAVSDFNSKGKHTTTARELFQLANGSLLIDTPGMREFGLTSEDGENTLSLFPAMEEFAQRCRYVDCKHINEPGCSVLEALHEGVLDTQVYESYIKLMKEQRRFEIKMEDKKRLNKQFGKITREAKNYRKKYKF
jgi:ribosome biogenesis GTPase / thiamine phosphate phosphatase